LFVPRDEDGQGICPIIVKKTKIYRGAEYLSVELIKAFYWLIAFESF
jgi:hypothetical protein